MNDIQALKEKVKDLKVLFVDDEKDVRHGTGMFLRKFFDNVVVCEDGQGGLSEFLKNEDFDVVITDILMPVMDGVEMVKEIRKIDTHVFVIFLTASRGVNDLDKDLSNIILQKPLSFDDIILVMQKLQEIK